MAISTLTFAKNQWQAAVMGETNTGVKNSALMKLLNFDGDVTVTSEVTQKLDPRSSVGRTVKVLDMLTTDEGGHLTTISFSMPMDTTMGTYLLTNAITGTRAGETPYSYDLPYDYAPDARGYNETSGSEKTSFTFALVSPITANTRFFTGCCITGFEVVWDSATDGGRGVANVTMETKFRPANGTTDPTSMVAYSTNYSYLHDIVAVKTIDGNDVVLNKLGYNISNPTVFGGEQGTYGEPETITRGNTAVIATITAGVKFDANTQDLWESRRDGDIIEVVFANAAWGSATLGFKASYCKITNDVQPVDTDGGVFQDVELFCGGSTSGDLIQIIPQIYVP